MRKAVFVIALLVLLPQAFAQQEPRTITVTGTGTAEATPDHAIVQMSIVAKDPSLAAAQSSAADVTARVLALTDDLGIDRDRVDTTGSSARPDYVWNRDDGEQELRGYIAERQMSVEVRDLEKLGVLIESAVNAGVNHVSPPQLESSERRDAHRQALHAAALDAKANAEQLARSLGARLGSILQVTSASQPSPPMPYLRGVAAEALSSAPPETYNAASLKFEASITTVFELVN